MSEDYNTNDLLERVKDGLKEMDLTFAEEPDRPYLRTASCAANGFHSCRLQLHPDFPLISFSSHVQCRVPTEKRPAMAEFLNRANCGLWFGNFELVFADGEVRYRTALSLADGVLTTDMLADLVYANVQTLDRYLPGIMSILWNDVSAEDAIGLCEAA